VDGIAKTLVSAIIPARNEEASIALAVESIAAQLEVGEVIVVNDQSTDATGAILAELAARVPKLRVLETGALPAGWVGKNYAVSIGAAAAKGEWLLLTDADTFHYSGSTRRALMDAVDHNAVLVSYSPEQELQTWWERALIPFVYCRLAAKFSFARVNDPARPDAAANGQFVLMLRDAYEAVGGHAGVARELLEDVALARLVKQSGYGIYFTAPMGVVRTRMYRSFAAMWQGWTKNLYPLVGGNSQSLFYELVEILPIAEAGLLIVALLHFSGVRDLLLAPALGMSVGALLARYVAYAAALYRNLYPTKYIQYCSVGSALYCAVLMESWWKSTRGKVVWKGREYAAKMP
jgi:glycosyltransferase involved in cell wall biosynthesis